MALSTGQPVFSFQPEAQEQARAIVARYPEGRQASALAPLLDLAQRQNKGFLSRDAIFYVADFLDVPAIRAFEVASFYSMFNLEPVGLYLIQICRTTPCWLAGSDDLKKAIEEHLGLKVGQTSEDKLFTLREVECLGACVNAPAVQINDDYYEALTPETLIAILKALARGEKPVYAPCNVAGRCSCACKKEKTC
ncbi:MAG: NADH-quinone oxidoreductase subunit NuoE [Alphaproteobacteria bacterium]|nr:NADH-quinone oxidoreductase subunit NuoE [Alphaproteobacteria bacterium]